MLQRMTWYIIDIIFVIEKENDFWLSSRIIKTLVGEKTIPVTFNVEERIFYFLILYTFLIYSNSILLKIDKPNPKCNLMTPSNNGVLLNEFKSSPLSTRG